MCWLCLLPLFIVHYVMLQCELIRQLSAIRGRMDLPLLIGPSRKGFLAKILAQPRAADHAQTQTQQPPASVPAEVSLAQRQWATAAAVTACVQQGADVVRVHDVAELAPVVRVADELYRARTR